MTHFTDRASYKAYVIYWKSSYAALSEEIRETKKQMKIEGDDQPIHQYRREMLRRDALEMLNERAASKVTAQEQYQAELLAKALV